MAATQFENPPLTLPATHGAAARALAALGLAASLFFVLFAGTFPFDFNTSDHTAWSQVQQNFDWRLKQYDPNYTDRTQNILFFLPLGFFLASTIRARRFRRAAKIAAAALAGAVLSVVVEVLQSFVSFRDPSLADVWCNTLGGVLGAGLFAVCGEMALRLVATALLMLRPLAKLPVLAAALLAYSIAHLAAPLALRSAADLTVWSPQMHLAIGNRLTGDRGWNGNVADVVLTDRAATPRQAAALFHGDDPQAVMGPSLLGHYRPRGRSPFPDQSSQLNPLVWNADPTPLPNTEAVAIWGDFWLRTDGTISPAIQRIRQTRQFTLAATIWTDNFNQTGSARIASLGSPIHESLHIGQDFRDLSVRVGTAMRSMPDLYVRDVLADSLPHHIVVTHQNAQVVVYVDGRERGRVEVTPEAKVIWRLYPRSFRIRIEQYGFRSYAAIYRLLVFIPFAALLGATIMLAPWRHNIKRAAAAAATVTMALLLEIILGTQTASGFQVRNLAIGLVVGFAALGGMWWVAGGKKARRHGGT